MAHLKAVPKPPISAKEGVKRRIRTAPNPASFIRCHCCGSQESFPVKSGSRLQGGKAVGGTKILLCAHCYMKGDRVVLL